MGEGLWEVHLYGSWSKEDGYMRVSIGHSIRRGRCWLTWLYDPFPNGVYMVYISDAVQTRGGLLTGHKER
jgi:hypothetical protein